MSELSGLNRFRARKKALLTEKKTEPRYPTNRGRKITKVRFLKALEETGGRFSRIAARLECDRRTAQLCLERPDWDDVRQAYKDETERVLDIAEETIEDVMTQRLDLKAAADVSKWWLNQKAKGRGYAEKQTVQLEGGSKPIQVQQTEQIPLETLDLPLEVRRQVLEALEKKKLAEQTAEDTK